VKPSIINKNNTITKQTLPWTYSLGELLKIQYKPIYNFLKILLKIIFIEISIAGSVARGRAMQSVSGAI
jgi:hypothetical protein